MFVTEDNFQILSEASTFYCDATLSVCPRLFYQVRLLHDNVTVLRNTCNTALLRLKEACQNYIITLEPKHNKADFQLALMQNLKLSFPSASFNGCLYYFAQAIHRKLQSLDLQTEFRQMAWTLANFSAVCLLYPLSPQVCEDK